MKSNIKKKNSAKLGGFSLIEVTIAMAIAAFALVTLLGLIPQGMSTMQQAGDEAITARIHQQILNELQMSDFDLLRSTYDQRVLYYDSQGEELGSNKDPNAGFDSFQHVYSARISIPEMGRGLPGSVGGGLYSGFKFDGSTANEGITSAVIEVAVVGGVGKDFDWDDEDNFHLIKSYHTAVAKLGRAFD